MGNENHNKIKSLFRNTSLFFVASVVPKAISFLLVPLYTACLTTGEYGTIDLVVATAQLLLPLLTVQVQDAVLRFALEKKNDRTQVFSIGLRIVLWGFVILLAGTWGAYGCGILRLEEKYIVFFLFYYLISALHNIFTYFLRAIDKVKHITIATVLNSIVTVGSNLLFLLVFRWGVSGYLLANVLGHLTSLLFMWGAVRLDRYVTFRKLDGLLAKQIVLFSLPMVLSAISWWINNSLDRYILTWFCGVSASGLLAVAYKIPTIISTLGSTVSKAYSVSVIQSFDPEDTDGFLGQSYATISFLMVLFSSGLMILNIPLSGLLFSNDFFAAWVLVPPLLVSAAMNYMSLSCEHMCIALNKTSVISLTALLGALVNTALNLCLIPPFGAYGAALATALGFFIVWLVRYVWVIRRVNLKNGRVKEPVSYGLLLCQMVLAYWGNRFLALQILLAAVIALMYGKEAAAVLKKLKSHRK